MLKENSVKDESNHFGWVMITAWQGETPCKCINELTSPMIHIW